MNSSVCAAPSSSGNDSSAAVARVDADGCATSASSSARRLTLYDSSSTTAPVTWAHPPRASTQNNSIALMRILACIALLLLCARDSLLIFAIEYSFRNSESDFPRCLRNQNVHRWSGNHGCYCASLTGFRFDNVDSQSRIILLNRIDLHFVSARWLTT